MPETPNIPKDIIIDILRRLPAKSIARFRCVSKPWLSMLTDSNFINHVNKNWENHKLLVVYPSLSLHALTLTPQNHYVSRKINFPPSLDPAWFQIVQSCGGLVLAVCNKGMFLINPTNSNFYKIPEIPFNLHPPSFCLYEFVYDEYTDHFKIFNLSCYDGHRTFVDVYSLKSSCWTRIGVSPFDHFSCLDPSGVLFHGAIHWPALPEYLHAFHADRDYLPLIAAFDLGTEKFREVELPNDMDGVEFSLIQLLVLDCCLCMIIDYDYRSGVYVWMMKEYGVRGSWIKLMRLSNDFDFLIPVRVIGDDDLVVSKGETGGVEIFNVKEGRFRSFVIDGAPAKVRDGCAFVESLVSLNLNC